MAGELFWICQLAEAGAIEAELYAGCGAGGARYWRGKRA